ncbi:MAG: DNA-3-methyladenine glycosylase 2 family protein [Deltaproteobacteria bacterium]|nr:DNA-3-methyladenine glycosylase 2 family protein [Deltaproteobacteria bacterium]
MDGGVELDPDTCYRAVAARDRRFDGLFFVAVRTTGIYCRPVCPARTPGRDRCTFFARAAEAEREGYRACFRCRPELAPGQGPVDAVPRLVAAAVSRIDAGALNEGSVEELAAGLGVTARHLRRALCGELGLSPVELAQSRRMALAKQLLQDTALPMAEVAFAAGFGSLRRFNALFRSRFGRPPSALRRAHAEPEGGGLWLRLDYRPPLDWEALLAFLAARATEGVEEVRGGAYRRTVRLGRRAGWVEVRPLPGRPALRAQVSLSLAGALMPLAARLRALFDLDALPHLVSAHLAADPRLRPAVRARPGLRVPGAFDGFEAATRVVLGQQVSVAAATTVAGRLARALGEPCATPFPALHRLSPTPEAVAAAGEARIARLGMPGARARTLLALADAVAGGSLRLERGAGAAERERLRALPGVGDWTAQVIAMRALGDPDAFPAGDLAVRRALEDCPARDADERSAAWRPWRAYAALHLWTATAAGAGA